jgi:hypothetical protein
MIHPLLQKLATQPGLFVEHASGYAELAVVEAQAAAQAWQQRVLLFAAAALLAAVALVFSGMAGLLASALPVAQMPLPWLLLLLPLAFWISAAVVAWVGWRRVPTPVFGHLRQQWSADMQLMRDVAEHYA